MRSLFWATAFLTIFPVGVSDDEGPPPMRRIAHWFPVVGMTIGVISGLSLFLLVRVMMPAAAALFALAIYEGITRLLHLDALADTADGLLGGRDKESRLRIMRDSSVGTFGATALFFALAIKLCGFYYAAHFAEMTGHIMPAVAYVMIIIITGRWAMVYHSALYPYAREGEGTARLFCDSLKTSDALTSGIFPFIACVGMLGLHGGVMLAAGMISSCIAGAIFARAVDGATGDTAGACGEIAEAGSVTAMMILIHLNVSAGPWIPFVSAG